SRLTPEEGLDLLLGPQRLRHVVELEGAAAQDVLVLPGANRAAEEKLRHAGHQPQRVGLREKGALPVSPKEARLSGARRVRGFHGSSGVDAFVAGAPRERAGRDRAALVAIARGNTGAAREDRGLVATAQRAMRRFEGRPRAVGGFHAVLEGRRIDRAPVRLEENARG